MPCQNNGTCWATKDYYNCTCAEGETLSAQILAPHQKLNHCSGWTGTNCTEPVDPCTLSPPVCNMGNCSAAADLLSYTCSCWDNVIDGAEKCDTLVGECRGLEDYSTTRLMTL